MWIQALFYKELRQLTAPLLLGLLAVMVNLLSVVNSKTDIPFYNATMDQSIPFVAGGLAIVLGFWQTLSEYYRSTWLFLWHRPVSRQAITLVKIGSGLLLYGLVMSVPILIHAWRSSIPGNVAAPFYWDMTYTVWKNLWVMTPLYLGAYLSGLRRANWFGTRLFPLAALSPFAMLTVYWFWTVIIAAAVINLLYLIAIFQQLDQEDYS